MSEHEHGHNPNKYRNIYLLLLALLVISVAGPFLGILWVTLITAFGIAVVKATLVIQHFMHLKDERVIIKWMLASSLILMILLFFGVASDVMKHEGANWENLAAKEAVARGLPEPEHGDEGGDHAAAGDDHGEGEDHATAEGGEEEHAEGADEEHAEGADEEHVEGADEEHAEGAEGEHADGTAEGAAPAAPAFDVAAAYESVCSTCHGTTGAGDGVSASAMDPAPADFTDPAFWADRTEDQVVAAILQGGAAVGRSALMPGWSALYDEDQAHALAAHLRDEMGPGN